MAFTGTALIASVHGKAAPVALEAPLREALPRLLPTIVARLMHAPGNNPAWRTFERIAPEEGLAALQRLAGDVGQIHASVEELQRDAALIR